MISLEIYKDYLISTDGVHFHCLGLRLFNYRHLHSLKGQITRQIRSAARRAFPCAWK